MAANPLLLRRVAKADMPDPDWAASQVVPSASICIDVAIVKEISVEFVAFNVADEVVNPSGTISLQPIKVAKTIVGGRTLVSEGATDMGVNQGDDMRYNVSLVKTFTLRVAAHALSASVSYIDIYWTGGS